MTEKGERNWLIRTRSMQILGPVSLAKVIELIDKGSLRDEDEVTSGNGYWFCIRETELVDKYLHQSIPQEFNPITEAESVLATPKQVEGIEIIDRREEEDVTPLSAEDLEYPDMDNTLSVDSGPTEEIEEPEIIVADLNDIEEKNEVDDLKSISHEIEPPELLESKIDADNESSQTVNELEKEVEKESEEPPAIFQKVASKKSTKKVKPAPRVITKNDRYLFVLLFLVAGLIFGVIYYYRTILNKPLPGFETSWLMNSAHAQNAILSAPSKKKTLINSFR